MSPDVSFFVCENCGSADRSTDVDYDRLGYPVCPGCGQSEAPTVTADADAWIWGGEPATAGE